MDVSTGTCDEIETPTVVAYQPVFSPCGRKILFLGADNLVAYGSYGVSGARLFVLELEANAASEVAGADWAIATALWMPDGERIVIAGDYRSRHTIPTIGLWVLDPTQLDAECRSQGMVGTLGVWMHHDMPNLGADNVIINTPGERDAYATVSTGGRIEIWRIALEGSIDCEAVVSESRSCVLMDACATGRKLLYSASDLLMPWEMHAASFDGSDEVRLTHFNDAVIRSWPEIAVREMKVSSPDGLQFDAWTIAPCEHDGDARPTVMFIHAGPMLATGHIFRFDFRLLASNGFRIVFANFRGSAGYGAAFMEAIRGDFGARGFPDHIALVDRVVADGLADCQRLGVWGISHGGFATCWLVSHSDRFKAAVAASAWTSFSTLYYLSDATAWIVHDLGGRPDEVPDIYRSRSPLNYAHRCTTPTLLLHGEDDLRCPIVEAEQFYRALQDQGCVTELARIAQMNHFGSATGPIAVRIAHNEALLDWFERFL